MKKIVTLLILWVICSQSCISLDTPENYFDRTTLNTNKFSQLGAKDFEQMRHLKKSNALYANIDGEFTTTDRYELHMITYKIPEIENDIKRIKDLKVTEDTKEMIEASLEVFDFVKSKYENDYIQIAKLMDENAARKDINAKINKLEEQIAPEMDKRINALMEVALPYAKRNGIKVSTY